MTWPATWRPLAHARCAWWRQRQKDQRSELSVLYLFCAFNKRRLFATRGFNTDLNSRGIIAGDLMLFLHCIFNARAAWELIDSHAFPPPSSQISLDFGPDYMEDFRPGLSFSLVNRAEISARTSNVLLRKQRFRLHDKKFSPG